MPIRIVDTEGKGFSAKVYDAETGEDLTVRLNISSISIDLNPTELARAQITAWIPQVDILVRDAIIQRICPYCGHREDSDGIQPATSEEGAQGPGGAD